MALGLAVTSQGRLMIMKSMEIAESDQFKDSVVRTIYGFVTIFTKYTNHT